jgi:hypothetical protein
MAELGTEDAGARMQLGEAAEDGDRVGTGHGVGIADDHVRRARLGNAAIRVRGVAQRPLVLDHAHALHDRAAEVLDHDRLVDLRDERLEAARQLRDRIVDDHHRRDRHSSSR